MKLSVVNKLHNPKQACLILNRKIDLKNERAAGFSSKTSKLKLAWKRRSGFLDIRFKAAATVVTGDPCQIILGRNEVFLLASRYLQSMDDEVFLQKVRTAGGMAQPKAKATE